MIRAEEFIKALKRRGVSFVSGTPCSYLKPLINRIIDDPEVYYCDALNEGDAVAIAAGAHVGGTAAMAIFQNSGLGNAVNALSSLCHPFRIPVVLVVTHRGQPGGPTDEPQHELMGRITPRLLDLMGIKWEPMPRSSGDIVAAVDRCLDHMADTRLPFAFLMSKGTIEPHELATPPPDREIHWDLRHQDRLGTGARRPYRYELLKAYVASRNNGDLAVCTTGYTGRELFALDDAPCHWYMVGSMGSSVSFALGLALNRPRQRIFVFDGDGAVLMRMGNLALIGGTGPRNLIHIVVDNAAYESTGGQATRSREVSITGIAAACGYRYTEVIDELAAFEARMGDLPQGPAMLHVRVQPGTLPDLGRPKVKPHEVKERFMAHLAQRG